MEERCVGTVMFVARCCTEGEKDQRLNEPCPKSEPDSFLTCEKQSLSVAADDSGDLPRIALKVG